MVKRENFDNFELCTIRFREDVKRYRVEKTTYEAPKIVGCFGGCVEGHYKNRSHYYFQLPRCLDSSKFATLCDHLGVSGAKYIYNELGEKLL